MKKPANQSLNLTRRFALALNNSLNELLHGVGIGETEALELLGVTRRESARIYAKWTAARGWDKTGVR